VTRLADARWPEVEQADRTVLVVPIGSLEQHGPHLPLDTDAFLASTVAERLAASRPSAGLAPTLPVGASGEHADFPGTLSIGTAALRELVIELVRDASRHWRAVLVINGHGGNARGLAEAAERCRYEGRQLTIHHLALPGMDGHAGHAETSMMLHLDPARVDVDAATPGPTTPVEQLMPALVRDGVRSVSPDGVLGDPRSASAQEGRDLVGRLVADALAVHDRCRQQALATPTGPPEQTGR
jgi:mycofactocin precursor peptide peptidase